MNLPFPILYLLLVAALSLVSLSTADAQATPRLFLTQISIEDYADLTIPESMKKLEAACNKTEVDMGDVRIVIEGKISYSGKVRGLFEKMPQESTSARHLLRQIASKASLSAKFKGDRVTLRARTKADELQTKAHQDMEELVQGVTLEKLHLVDTKPTAALAYLERAFAKRSPDKKPVKFRMSGEESPGNVTLDLQNVPMSEAVRYVAGLSGFEFSVTKEKRTIWFKQKATK